MFLFLVSKGTGSMKKTVFLVAGSEGEIKQADAININIQRWLLTTLGLNG